MKNEGAGFRIKVVIAELLYCTDHTQCHNSQIVKCSNYKKSHLYVLHFISWMRFKLMFHSSIIKIWFQNYGALK